MFSVIMALEEKSETIRQARQNVKKISLVKEILVFIVLYLIILFSQVVLQLILDPIGGSGELNDLIELFSFIAIIIAVLLIVTKVEKRSFRSVGISKGDAIPSFLKGLAIGFLMFSAVVVIGMALGQYRFRGFDFSIIISLIPLFLCYMVQSFAEEFHERGWALTFISKRHSVVVAIMVSSITFALTHVFNPGVDVIAITNCFLVGIVFSVMFLIFDNIWICGAAHTIWNFSETICGFCVSGTSTESAALLKFTQTGNNFICGGRFGLESGLIVTSVLLITLIVLIYWYKR